MRSSAPPRRSLDQKPHRLFRNRFPRRRRARGPCFFRAGTGFVAASILDLSLLRFQHQALQVLRPQANSAPRDGRAPRRAALCNRTHEVHRLPPTPRHPSKSAQLTMMAARTRHQQPAHGRSIFSATADPALCSRVVRLDCALRLRKRRWDRAQLHRIAPPPRTSRAEPETRRLPPSPLARRVATG